MILKDYIAENQLYFLDDLIFSKLVVFCLDSDDSNAAELSFSSLAFKDVYSKKLLR
jgi:hypothetical protein